MKSKFTTTRWIFLIALAMSFGTTGVLAQNAPHAVWGTVVDSRNQPPRADKFAFYAYISTRPNEVLTVNSYGCGYHEPDGTWWLNTGNFATPWKIGEVLVVELIAAPRPEHVERKVITGILTGAGNDYFGSAMLEPLKRRASKTTPVTLVHFRAKPGRDGRIELSWQTASEINNQGFTVERALGETNQFSAIGFVPGSATSATEKQYSFKDIPPAASRYKYRLKQIDFNGDFSYSSVIEVENTVPEHFRLLQNYPNPFRARINPVTTIGYDLHESGRIRLRIFDVLGRTVRELIDARAEAGRHEIQWDGRDLQGRLLPAGLYFYELEAGGHTLRKSLLLIR